MDSWSFLSTHGRVLLLLAHDPAMRLRDIAITLGITERSAYGPEQSTCKAKYAGGGCTDVVRACPWCRPFRVPGGTDI